MGNKDFDSLTPAQMSRDSMLVEKVREEYIVPLLDELEKAIPSYSAMDEWERFVALMKLNEDVAPVGDFLMLDFGHRSGSRRSPSTCARTSSSRRLNPAASLPA